MTYEVFGREETEKALRTVLGMSDAEVCSTIRHIEEHLHQEDKDAERQ